ncbi:MAG TPA: hypothetical protein VER33_18555, partial [Polyangiaceae bacterium]|nr:hypothetical protein [Polyangiaceae bacterium]
MRLAIGGRASRLLFEAVFLLASLSLAWPLFVARYVPIQDLPQHVAAVRVLHDFNVPGLAFERFFERSLLSTQYLSVYLLADLLTSALGALLACKCILAASMVGVPFAARKLLAELRQPQSYALFTLPLAYHAHWLLGFINFVAALPLMLWGIALAVRWRRQGSRRTGLALGKLGLVTFYTHVVPFAVLVLASCMLAVGGTPRATLRRLWPLLPSAAATAVWLATSPAGHALLTLAGPGQPHRVPSFATPEESLRDLPSWLTDTLVGSSDGWTFVAWLLLCAIALVLGVREPAHARVCHTRRASGLRVRVALLVPLAWAAYFVLPTAYTFIWPINARFPILALL